MVLLLTRQKYHSFLLFLTGSLVLCFGCSGALALEGDSNNDGFVTVKDSIVGLQVVSGSSIPAAADGDVNTDEKIGVAEVLFSLRLAAGLEQLPEVWRPLMMRSEEEAQAAAQGSGAEQHFHGIARSFYNPDYIYAVQDIAGPWRSRDGGKTWQKTVDKGLWCRNSDSIEVDPVNPDKILVQMDNWNGYRPQEQGGIFLSLDGGDNWQRVFQLDWNDDYTFEAWEGPRQTNAYLWSGTTDVTGEMTAGFNHRLYTHNIEWSPVGVDATTSPTHWFAAFPRDFLYYSVDGGESWSKGADLGDYQFIYSVESDPVDQNLIYIATEKGLLVSSDGGETAQQRGIWNVHNVERDEERTPESLIAFPREDQNEDVYKYIRIYSFVIDPHVPGTFWAIGRWYKDETVTSPSYYNTREWLFKSTDFGYTWNEAENQPWPAKRNLPHRLFIHPDDGNYLYVTNRWGYLHKYSQDGGRTWLDGAYGETHPGFMRDETWRKRLVGNATGIVPNAQDTDDVVAYAHATFWKSMDQGKTFNESASGFNGIAWSWYRAGISFDLYNPDRIATFNCDVNIRITDDGWGSFRAAENLEEINGWATSSVGETAGQGSHAGSIQIVPDSQVMVANIGQYSKTRLMRSVDSGKNWTLIENLPLPDGVEPMQTYWNGGSIYYVGFSPLLTDRVWAANMISDDGGQTFRMIDFGLDKNGNPYKSSPMVLGYSFHHPETVYAIGNYGRTLVRSDDSGNTWYTYSDDNVQVPWDTSWFDSQPFFEVDPFDPDRVYIVSATGGVAMFDGTGWTEIFAGADIPGKTEGNHMRSIAADPTNEGVIYVGCILPGYDGLWKTTDRGQSWENISKNMPRIENSAMKVNPHTGELYMGSYVGTWVYPAHR